MELAELPLTIDRERLAQFCRERGIRKLSLFGSVLREDFDPARSDVDVLVEYRKDRVPGWEFVSHADDLERLLGRKVDYCTRLSRLIREHPGFAEYVVFEEAA
jgi:hypothetical protein